MEIINTMLYVAFRKTYFVYDLLGIKTFSEYFNLHTLELCTYQQARLNFYSSLKDYYLVILYYVVFVKQKFPRKVTDFSLNLIV